MIPRGGAFFHPAHCFFCARMTVDCDDGSCLLTALPPDVLYLVLDQLTVVDRSAAALTCTALRKACAAPQLWHRVDLSKRVFFAAGGNTLAHIVSGLCSCLCRWGNHIHELRLSGWSASVVLSVLGCPLFVLPVLQKLDLYSDAGVGEWYSVDDVELLQSALQCCSGRTPTIHLDVLSDFGSVSRFKGHSLRCAELEKTDHALRLRNFVADGRLDPQMTSMLAEDFRVWARKIISCGPPEQLVLRGLTGDGGPPMLLRLFPILFDHTARIAMEFPGETEHEAVIKPMLDFTCAYCRLDGLLWRIHRPADVEEDVDYYSQAIVADHGWDDELLPPTLDDDGNEMLPILPPHALLTLRSISLHGCGLLKDQFTRPWARLMRRLARLGISPPLTALDMRDNRLRNSGCVAIALIWHHAQHEERMAQSPPWGRIKLRELLLSGNGISKNGIQALAEGLRSPYCELTTLDLSGSRVCLDACRALALGIGARQSLTSLDLYDCSVSDEGAIHLAAGVHRSGKLEHLRLGRNSIRDEGCAAFARAISDPNCGLRVLDLAMNRIGPDGGRALASALRVEGCALRTLVLRINCLGDEGCAEVGAACFDAWAGGNRGLSKLVLARNVMSDIAAWAISSAIDSCFDAGVHPRGLELDVGFNDTTHAGNAAMLRAVGRLPPGAVILRGIEAEIEDEEVHAGQVDATVQADAPAGVDGSAMLDDAALWGTLLL